jgi:hypothetical protein
LSRVPDAVSQIEARRIGNDVYVTFLVPSQNVDQSQPADTARIDVFAVTADRVPPPGSFLQVAERVASVAVARQPSKDKGASRAGEPDTSHAVQGARTTIREQLDVSRLTPKTVVVDEAKASETGEAGQPMAPRRYYMAVAYSDRDRSVGRGEMTSVPASPPPGPPAGVTSSYSETSIALSWTPAEGATAYNVYRDDTKETEAPGTPPASASGPPAPVNGKPLDAPSFSEPVAFGRERCYRIRAIRTEDGSQVEGEASERRCETPEDRFPPAAPSGLVALTQSDGIALKWVPNTETDLAGYLVLRGRAGDATLLPLTPTPVVQTQFMDRDVMSGMRYVYAVVAVDTRAPAPNRSPESERNEATAP